MSYGIKRTILATFLKIFTILPKKRQKIEILWPLQYSTVFVEFYGKQPLVIDVEKQ